MRMVRSNDQLSNRKLATSNKGKHVDQRISSNKANLCPGNTISSRNDIVSIEVNEDFNQNFLWKTCSCSDETIEMYAKKRQL
jgi:hypothetical protein